MKEIVFLGLIGFVVSVDVCVNYSASNYCKSKTEEDCQNDNATKKFCRVRCAQCSMPRATPDSGSLKGSCLAAINAKRQLHQDTPDVEWDGVAETQAQAVVENIIAGENITFGKFNYYGAIGYTIRRVGQNLSTQVICQEAVNNWNDQGNGYDYANPAKKGAFTQLIWKSSSKVGVGIAYKKDGNLGYAYILANFWVAGNKGNSNFAENIMPLKLKDTPKTTPSPPTTPTSVSSHATAHIGYCTILLFFQWISTSVWF